MYLHELLYEVILCHLQLFFTKTYTIINEIIKIRENFTVRFFCGKVAVFYHYRHCYVYDVILCS